MTKIWEILKAIPQTLQLVLVAALVYLGTSWFSNNQTKSSLEEYIDKYTKFQKEAEQSVRIIDSVTKVNKEKDVLILTYIQEANTARAENARILSRLPDPAVVASLRTNIDSLKAATSDSVEMARTVIPAQDTLIKALDSTVVVLRLSQFKMTNENVALRSANTLLISEKSALELSLADARSKLVNLPPPPENPDKFFFGLLNKPSRTQLAVIGFVGGVVTYAVVDNSLKR